MATAIRLASLLVRANRIVSVDELAELVWDGAPPPGAARTVRSYMARLRHVLGPVVAGRIVTRDPGYCCRVDGNELDTSVFDVLCQQARTALHAEDWSIASNAAEEALELWRGTPLSDVGCQVLCEQVGRRFDQSRLQVLEIRAEAQLRLGMHEPLVSQLRELTAQHPLHERFHTQLIQALARCGHRAAALEAYRMARHVLVGELGIEPGHQLQALHQALLHDGPVLSPAALPTQRPVAANVVPRQLPAEAGHFTGRARELAALSELLDGARPGRGSVVIAVIAGTAGVGKTALAVHWAHQAAERFPDGQLYVNLRGHDSREPMSSADALAGFLRALGVDGRDVPQDEAERSAMYRSLLAGRRILVVLDNTCGAAQVRPLLPGTVGCVAVVTSRGGLSGLVARDGATRTELDVLAPAESRALLTRLIGPRAHAAPRAVNALAERCCHLPLALRLAAELTAARPATPLSVLADELADLQHRLDVLDADGDEDAAVRSVFSWSYRSLDAHTARAFRLTALHPGADLHVHAAAALLSTTADAAGRWLGRLVRAHLLHPTGPARYGMHDLLRAYARERAAEDGDDMPATARDRLLDHYLHTASAAMNTLYPAEIDRRPALAPPAGALVMAPVTDRVSARAWLDAERANLIEAASCAAQEGSPGHAIALAGTIERYLNFGHHLAEATAMHSTALRAADQVGDPIGKATALSNLGFLEWMHCRYEQAASFQQQALDLFVATAHRAGEARVLHRLALVERALGNFDSAALHATRVLWISRHGGDRLGQARALQSLGITQLGAGLVDAAAQHLRESLTLFDALDDRLGQSVSIKAMGMAELRAGRIESAEDLLREALALCEETNNPPGKADVLSRLGEIHLRGGRHDVAVQHQELALDLYRQVKDRAGEGEVMVRLATAYIAGGNPAAAMVHLSQALRLSRELGTRQTECEALNGMGDALLAVGRADDADTHYAAADRIATQVGDAAEQARARHGLATTQIVAGAAEQANRATTR
jgi:DNA-binding SARP family transcriptional activator/tetratricopeptide (TPR) repeat protein